ncbi:hypothetical protein ACXVUM_12205 [Williamsia sp. SKLECPSW1]
MEPATDQSDDRTVGRSRTSRRAAAFLLAGLSVVASGVVIVGVQSSSPTPRSVTAGGESSTRTVVDEPVDPSAPIPGCATVTKPQTGGEGSIQFSVGDSEYDNPRFPWFGARKAMAMSTAAIAALPPRAELQFARPTESLIFQPITDFGDPVPSGSTNAYGDIVTGVARGRLQIVVGKGSGSVPPCVAGALDERRTLPDSTVVDVLDTWQEVDGVRTITRSATAYASDGSHVGAIADDRIGEDQKGNSGLIPLSIDDLVRIAATPGLRVSAPVPPGTPEPPPDCGFRVGDAEGVPVSGDQARRLDAVLATADFPGAHPEPLRLSDDWGGVLCTVVPGPDPGAQLDIAIVGGQPLPVEGRPDPSFGPPATFRRLADGSVVQTDDSFASSPGEDTEASYPRRSRTVTVTRPTGTRITVRSLAAPTVMSGAAPTILASPVDLTRLEAIALTPGLTL